MLTMQNFYVVFLASHTIRFIKKRDNLKSKPNIYYTKQDLVSSNPPKKNTKSPSVSILCIRSLTLIPMDSWMLLLGHCFSQRQHLPYHQKSLKLHNELRKVKDFLS